MRWLYLILAVIGLGFVMKQFCEKQATHVVYVVPGIHVGVTWAMIAVFILVGMGAAKLKFGK